MRMCGVPDCGKKHYAKGCCRKHWERQHDHGSTDLPLRKWQKELAWLELHRGFDGDDCLIWPYNRYRHGYAAGRRGGTHTTAHRLMCELAHGPAPSPQHDAAHSCHNRGCVNPRHLRWATKIENQHDRIENDTHIRGRKNPNAKLSEADVLAIRSSIDTTRSLADRFSITPSTVNDIRSGRAWGWLAITKGNHA